VNTRGLQFTINPKPLPDTAGAPVSLSLQEEIGKAFGEGADQIRFAILAPLSEESQFKLLFGDLWRDLRRTYFRGSSLVPPPPSRPTYAHISLPLQSGEWLNVVVMPRGLAPPASSLLIQFATMAAISGFGIILVLGRLTRPLKQLSMPAG
jgi:hypothetical protein